MKVAVKELCVGMKTKTDVFCRTSQPLIRKNTVLTEDHLAVLKAFLIPEIDVYSNEEQEDEQRKKMISGTQERRRYPRVPAQEPKEIQREKDDFTNEYFRAVDGYQKLFASWQNGNRVDMHKLRQLFLPLFERVEENTGRLFTLYHHQKSGDYVAHHAVGAALLSVFIALKLHYARGDAYQIGISAALADCGMARISREILRKKGALSPAEYE